MGNVRYQSTLVQAGFYREIPVDQPGIGKRKAPAIASWGSTTAKPWTGPESCLTGTLLRTQLLLWKTVQSFSTIELLIH